MNKFRWFGLLMLAMFSIATVNAQGLESKAVITLERTACFGTCPVYTVNILEDGSVNYEGNKFVTVTGKQTSGIAPETVAAMLKVFKDNGYFEWNEAYDTQTVSDLPTVITSVTYEGTTHRIVRYAGDNTAPLALVFLEQWIDEIANTALWTGVQPDISSISNGTDMPVISLERGPNFGFGSVYKVVGFEDGTVVFTGIANVDEIGVHVFKTEAADITSVAQRAETFGYFKWQDSYGESVMTDQATITTSIRVADQFKRIVRYEGDPNAPIGIIRIEESIDQLVKDLVG